LAWRRRASGHAAIVAVFSSREARPFALEYDQRLGTGRFLRTHTASDATLNAARDVLGGDRGIVDLVGTMGLYQISSMTVALDKTPLPPGVKPYF
jgi:hypothetical protein